MTATDNMREWEPISTAPENTIVETKIDDAEGIRNETTLRRKGRLWFFPDYSMYVYYEPTHWRPVDTEFSESQYITSSLISPILRVQ
jgi:hypothetical protein